MVYSCKLILHIHYDKSYFQNFSNLRDTIIFYIDNDLIIKLFINLEHLYYYF